MKRLIAASLMLASTASWAAEAPVFFRVTIKQAGEVTDSPSFLADVGKPVILRLKGGLTIEALPKPAEEDGRSWTQVRITYFETPESKFVQEMSMRHEKGEQRAGSFEYSDPTNRRFFIQVNQQ